MKSTITASWPLWCVVMFVSSVQADLVEKQVIPQAGGEAVSTVVFQGSRNSNRVRKKQGTVSPVVVPPLHVVLSGSSEEPEQAAAPSVAKPRFGYGSDYDPNRTVTEPTTELLGVDESEIIYPFRAKLPSHREFHPVSPYWRYFSPYSYHSACYHQPVHYAPHWRVRGHYTGRNLGFWFSFGR